MTKSVQGNVQWLLPLCWVGVKHHLENNVSRNTWIFFCCFLAFWYQRLRPKLVVYSYRRGSSLSAPFLGVLLFCGQSTEAGFVGVNLSHRECLLKLFNIKVLLVCLEASIYERLSQILPSTLLFFDLFLYRVQFQKVICGHPGSENNRAFKKSGLGLLHGIFNT